jgi:hypothetical protein
VNKVVKKVMGKETEMTEGVDISFEEKKVGEKEKGGSEKKVNDKL